MKLFTSNIFAFIYGFLSVFSIRIIGIIYLSEIIAICLLPLTVLYYNKNKRNTLFFLFLFLFIWIVIIPISDLINDISLIDSIKGFFGVTPFLASILLAYYLLNRKLNLIVPFIWGYSFSFLIVVLFGLNTYYLELMSSEGVSSIYDLYYSNKIFIWILSGFISLAISITFYERYPNVIILVLFIFSLISLYNGARSNFLLNFFTVIVLLFNKFIKNRFLNIFKLSIRYFSIILMFFLILLSSSIYQIAVTSGVLGEDEYLKYEKQKETNIGILAGRGEFISSFLAIIDSPIFGHGSYAKDNKGFGYSAGILAGDEKYINGSGSYVIGESLIPTHSHLWYGWVNYGIFGALFWIYILFNICFRFMFNKLFVSNAYYSFNVYAIFSLTWNILFSPFADKTYLGFIIIYFLMTLKNNGKAKYL